MAELQQQNINIVPYASHQFWATPQEYEIWWEDPRDIFCVTVRFSAQTIPDPAGIALDYWQSSWPAVRVAKGAVVGAGESGWLANDDWTNGRWQTADCQVVQAGSACVITFHPLNRAEFPAEMEFPAVFRRTLKMRIHTPDPATIIEAVEAYTDSVWQEVEIAVEWQPLSGESVQWDGSLEAFNGEILNVRPLVGSAKVLLPCTWQSNVAQGTTAGIISRVRCAANPDPNSFDRTIVTLRSAVFGNSLEGISFFIEDVLTNGPVYLRDLGLIVSRPDQGIRLLDYAARWEKEHPLTLYEKIEQLPEQTWEAAWLNMPPKRSRMYFVLGCEGSRQKFRVHPNGDVWLCENYIRRAPGKDTPRLGWDGHGLNISFGFPEVEPGYRAILENTLPVIHTTWVKDEVCYEQEAYADWLFGDMLLERMEGDDPVIVLMQVTLTNRSAKEKTVRLSLRTVVDEQPQESLLEQDGLVYTRGGQLRLLWDSSGAGKLAPEKLGLAYEVTLAAGQAHRLFVKIPHINLSTPEELSRLRELNYSQGKQRVSEFWRRRIAQGTQIRTPNETLNNFYQTHLMHMLVINDREPGSERNVARCGGFWYGSFPDEGCMAIDDLDRRGYNQEAERCLDLYLAYQGTVPLPGNFKSVDGVFYGGGGYEVAGYNRNHGWVLWALAQHYRYTRDREYLARIAPALVKGCDWIIRERQATMRPGAIQYGFLPSGSLEDVTDYWTWLATNAYAYWGFAAASEVMVELQHPEADRLLRESRAFGADLRRGFFAACARSPVVRLRDGRWVPHFPARQERRGRDFGWLREVLEGAVHLIYCGLIAPNEPAARWIMEDYEDNLFLAEAYGYFPENFERQWFHWGGFSNQSNLLLFPPIYLWRDQPNHYLRCYFNAFTSAFFPDTMTMCEHALPTLDQWRGDHFKSSDEANSTAWLRFMFFNEQGEDFYVGQAIPRAWFAHGQTMRVERARTLFGEASLEIISEVATGWVTVKLEPPLRNPPKRIWVRVRHPECKKAKEVWVDGLPHAEFDPDAETIRLEICTKPVEIRVKF